MVCVFKQARSGHLVINAVMQHNSLTQPPDHTQPLILYTRPDCHLCELAMDLMQQQGIRWRAVDIDHDLALIRKYGVRIPVLMRTDSGSELGWPFDAEQLRAFMQAD